MAILRPQPFSVLVRRLMEEPRRQDACFDLPRRKWWVAPSDAPLDFSVDFHGLSAGTPFGPAAGPHAQMAQNILLSWLAGSRIIEFKTIQILDELEIPRPCIDIRNIGFNIEWSQELKLEESAREYAAGAMLIAFAQAENLLGLEGEAAVRPDPVVFDLSVGYDLKGLQSDRMVSTIRLLMDARPLINRLRCEIPDEYALLRRIEVDPVLARTATISTFHGCPPEEIEGIAAFLMEEFGLHTVVKMNPTLLGRERVEHLLREVLGYDSIRIPASAFDHDLRWEDSLDLARRLKAAAGRCGVGIGFKFTNTLVVENDDGPFPPGEKQRYLSGAPLHVISLTLADEWRRAAGWHGALSFSAGIDKHNAADAVACGFVPVTTCTDLLKLGGYGRLPDYLTALSDRMNRVGALHHDEHILRAEGMAAQAVREAGADFGRRETGPPLSTLLSEPGPSPSPDHLRFCRENLRRLAAILDPADGAAARRAVFGPAADERDWDDLLPEDLPLAELFYETAVQRAAMLNHQAVAQRTLSDPRYRKEKNSAAPRRIDSHLSVFDCINCDKCIAACPNGAVFFYEVEPEERSFRLPLQTRSKPGGDAGENRVDHPSSEELVFLVRKKHQIAIVADWCNECGNCDTYCPELGGPFVEKPNFYDSLQDLRTDRRSNSYWARPSDDTEPADCLHAWIDGTECILEHAPGETEAVLVSGNLRVRFTWPEGGILEYAPGEVPRDRLARAWRVYHRLRVLLQGVARGERVNSVNAAFPPLEENA